MGKTQNQFAFTLAEILITLSIIGVVAALTIPSLITKNQEKETIVQLKKAYNVFSNAFSLAVVEYGEPSSWGWGNVQSDPVGSKNVMDKFAPYLNIIKRCNPTKGCWAKGVMYKYYNGGDMGIFDNGTTDSAAILADGMSFSIWTEGNNCTTWAGASKLENECGAIAVDVNGTKGPNTLAKDVFAFWVTEQGIIPQGTDGDLIAVLASDCRNSRGYGCTAWALIKENLDYPTAGTGWN